MKQDLSRYISSHTIGASKLKYMLWLIVDRLLFRNPFILSYRTKVVVLRLFGAEIGHEVIIKPSVQIKYPWKLIIGDFCWIGEHVWIDNVEPVVLESNICISQGALLVAGSHDYKANGFDYLGGAIYLESGVWIGAKAVVMKNVRCKSHSVLGALSVAHRSLNAYTIYRGNPALPIKNRMSALAA